MVDPLNPYAEAHTQPNGAGDARPEALAVIRDLSLVNQLTDMCALITGASSGLGAETARALYACGMRVIMQVRNEAKGQSMLDDIRASQPGSKGSLELALLELDSLASVRAGAAEIVRRAPKLHVLVCNAGVRNTPAGPTADGFETQFATNHLGHFLLFQLVRGALAAAATAQRPARVVVVSSGAHRNKATPLDDPNLRKPGAWDPRTAYGSSKTANIWMANHVDRLYAPQNVRATSVHPGAIFTGLQAGMDAAAVAERLRGDDELRRALKNPQQGAATQVWAAVAPVWGTRGGLYLEDMRVGHESESPSLLWGGHMKYIYDEKGEAELWRISNEMVGTTG